MMVALNVQCTSLGGRPLRASVKYRRWLVSSIETTEPEHIRSANIGRAPCAVGGQTQESMAVDVLLMVQVW